MQPSKKIKRRRHAKNNNSGNPNFIGIGTTFGLILSFLFLAIMRMVKFESSTAMIRNKSDEPNNSWQGALSSAHVQLLQDGRFNNIGIKDEKILNLTNYQAEIFCKYPLLKDVIFHERHEWIFRGTFESYSNRLTFDKACKLSHEEAAQLEQIVREVYLGNNVYSSMPPLLGDFRKILRSRDRKAEIYEEIDNTHGLRGKPRVLVKPY
jgi:hypothetical protein